MKSTLKKNWERIVLCLCMANFACVGIAQTNKKLDDQVINTMKTATRFMMDKVSYNGGFVWNYLPDMSRSWGEMEAKRTMVWIQPPGTPSVGHLLLDAYHATGDEYYYEAARKVANTLIWGQLECGGWNYVFDFAGENSLKSWYDTVGKNGWRLEEFQHYYGNATYDDAGTMEAAKFLLRMYVEKNDAAFRPALEKTIDFVLKSQYPVGGWPQRYPLMHDHPFQGKKDYSSFITLNDDVIPDATEFLIQCYQAMGLQGVKEPIMRAMYLMISLQQGEPYAGWADQYTVDDLKPAHARSYEPRSVNTGTTVRLINLMMEYYKLTADTRFLSGIPAAIHFLESMKLPESDVKKWKRQSNNPEAILVPRFVDPDTGKPLYVHRKGSNVKNGTYYIDQNIENTIGHYNSATFVNPSELRRRYEEVKKIPVSELAKNSPFLQDQLVPLPKYYTRLRGKATEEVARGLVKSLTKDGCWLSPLKSTSNPYKPYTVSGPSEETKYTTTFVGDEHDTSPYPCTTGELCISVGEYIDNMMKLISYLEK
uniref:pectate lyase n=1 Tax=Phocaeicola massiliensis TaxID=204516 RepID=UPI004026000A